MLQIVTHAQVERKIRLCLPGILDESPKVIVIKIVLPDVRDGIVDLREGTPILSDWRAVPKRGSDRVSNPPAKFRMYASCTIGAADYRDSGRVAIAVASITLEK